MADIMFKRNLTLFSPTGFAYDKLALDSNGIFYFNLVFKTVYYQLSCQLPHLKTWRANSCNRWFGKTGNFAVIIPNYSDILRYVQTCILNGIDSP